MTTDSASRSTRTVSRTAGAVAVQSRPASERTLGPSVDTTPAQPFLVKVIAAVALILIAMRITLPQGVEVGFVVAALLAPMWIGAVRRFRGTTALLIFGVVAAGAGIWLQLANRDDHVVDTGIATSTTVLLIGSVLSIGVILWARTLFTAPMVAVLFGIGLFLGVNPGTSQFLVNPYKFGFAIPLAVTGLALAHLSRRWWVEVLAVLVLTGLAAVNDARSTFGLLLLAVILLVAQLPLFRRGHRGSASLVSIGVVVGGIIVYNLGQTLVLSGILGEATTARSLAQFDASGSLVLGGRPELGATIALMRDSLWGFGAGVEPNPDNVLVAKEGMQAIGYAPNNGYVERYMFGGHIELHSVFGDLWAQTGVVGLLFVAVAVVLLFVGITKGIADGTASAVVLYVVAKSLWDLAFSPFFSAEPLFVLAIGLVAVPVARDLLDGGHRRNSTTVLMGPIRRLTAWKPARSRIESSATDAVAG